MTDHTPPIFKIILTTLEKIGLMGIALATVIAVSHDIMVMIDHGRVTLADLLLMFIYLEVLAMVGHYFQSGQLPVRFPLYIGIVALARYLILDIKEMEDIRIIAVSGAIVLLAAAVLVIRYGHFRFPYKEMVNWHDKTKKNTQDSSPNE